MTDERDRAFKETLERRRQEVENDAARQRKRAMSPDEKRARAVELQTEKHMRFYREHGKDVSEEKIRRDLARVAERSERRKNGE